MTTKRRSGILPSRCSEQRLALDAGLCGGLIRGRGLVSASGIDSPPSPECGIEGLPAAEGPHRAASGAAASGRQKASSQPRRRHPCRPASAALVAAVFEMETRGGGSQGRILSPVRRVPRPLPLRSATLQASGSVLERPQRSSRVPAVALVRYSAAPGAKPPLRPPFVGNPSASLQSVPTPPGQ